MGLAADQNLFKGWTPAEKKLGLFKA